MKTSRKSRRVSAMRRVAPSRLLRRVGGFGLILPDARRLSRAALLRGASVPALVLALGLNSGAARAQSVVTAIVPDGRTQTSVTNGSGGALDVTTATQSGGMAFNSFSRFSIAQGDTVGLHAPAGAKALVNLVRDEAVRIDGTLNAYQDGRIGANVVFAAPDGFIVGATGTVNVGSLSVRTPTRQFVDGIVDAAGGVDSAAAARLVSGDVPLSPTGLVRIDGRVNALGNLRIAAQSADIAGTVRANLDPAFVATVNVDGISLAKGIVERDGVIEIVGDEDVRITGTLSADASSSGGGGSVSVVAGRDIHVGGDALLSASAPGNGGAGGNVVVLGGRNADVATGARFEARGGRGGFVEISASRSVTLGAVRFDTGAVAGAAGTVLVDPDDLVLASDFLSPSVINLEATRSITLKSGVTVSSRSVAGSDHLNGTSIGNSFDITLKAPKIIVEAGANILAHATGGFTAGNISLLAAARDSRTSVAGAAQAIAQIEMAGRMRGRNLLLQATAEAISDYADGAQSIATTAGVTVAGVALGGTIGYARAEATATVKVAGTAELEASENITMTSATRAVASMSAITLSLPTGVQNKIGLGLSYGGVNANATTLVETGARLVARTGEARVRAFNNATSDISATSYSLDKERQAGGAFAINDSKVNAVARIASGVTLDVDGVEVLAHNDAAYKTSASTTVPGEGKAGLVVSVHLNETNATAELQSSVGTQAAPASRGVRVIAESLVHSNENKASSTVGSGFVQKLLFFAGESFYDSFKSLPSRFEGGDLAQKTSPFKFGSAVAFSKSSQKARASVGPSIGAGGVRSAAPAIVSSGDVAIVGRTANYGVRNYASSSINSEAKTGVQGNPDARTAISAAVAIGLYDHTADAFVADDVSITGRHIAVSAESELPLTNKGWFRNATGIGSVLSELISRASTDLNVYDTYVTSLVSAGGTATKTGVYGAVDYFSVDGDTRAWVGAGARLTSTAALPTGGRWSLGGSLGSGTLEQSDPFLANELAGISNRFSFGPRDYHSDLVVSARSEVETVVSVGKIDLLSLASAVDVAKTLKGGAVEGPTDSVALGGSFGLVNVATRAVAGIGSGANVTAAGRLDVSATNDTRLITIAPVAGLGAGVGINGMAAIAKLDTDAIASISNRALVSAPSIRLWARQTPQVWTAAGTLTLAENAGAGIAVALNFIRGTTSAAIEDNDGADEEAAPTPDERDANGNLVRVALFGAQRAAPANAGISTGSLDVSATTVGSGGAFAVAGAFVKPKDPGAGGNADEGEGDGPEAMQNMFGDALSKVVKKGKTVSSGDAPGKFDQVKAFVSKQIDYVKNDVGGIKNKFEKSHTSTASAATTKDVQKPKYAIAVAGSGTANVVAYATRAVVDGARVSGIGPTGRVDASLAATDALQYFAGSGGAALQLGSGGGQNFSAAVAGAVAVTISDNVTEAAFRRSTATQVNGFDVTGSSAGLNAAVALALAVNKQSSGNSASGAFAVNVGLIRDRVAAEVLDSSVTGWSVGANVAPTADMRVRAYDRTDIGLGGGAFFGGGRGGGGINFVFAEVSDPVVNRVRLAAQSARVTGSASGFRDLVVSSVNATRVVTAGAAGGGGGDTNSLAGAIVVSDVGTGAEAFLGPDSRTGSGSFVVGRDVLVDANSGRLADLDAAFGALGGPPAIDVEFDFDGVADQLANSVRTDYGGNPRPSDGASILTVAGLFQYGKNNLGISFASGNIHTRRAATISGAGVRAGRKVQARAIDRSSILGLAAGGGIANGSFAGVGSIAVNVVDTETSATIGRADDPGLGTQVEAPSILAFALDNAQISALAGSVAASKSGSVGIALGYNRIDSDATATIVNTALTSGDVGVRASTYNDPDLGTGPAFILAGAIAGTGGKDFGVAGAVTANEIFNTVKASLAGSTLNNPQANVSVEATDGATIKSLAGGAAGGSAAGVGASIAFNRIGTKVLAALTGSGQREIKTSDLSVAALARARIGTIAIGAGGAATAGISGSIATNLIGFDTRAEISGGALVDADDDVLVSARTDATIDGAAGAAGGGGTAGVGVGVMVNEVSGNTYARILGPNTRVIARDSDAASTVEVVDKVGVMRNGAFRPVEIATVTDAGQHADPTLVFGTRRVGGLAVNSATAARVGSVGIGIAGSFKPLASGAASAIVTANLFSTDTLAAIDGASINPGNAFAGGSAGQKVDVRAVSHSHQSGFATGVAGSGGGAGTAGVNAVRVAGKTRAIIMNSNVAARSGVDVRADAGQSAVSLALGVAGGPGALSGSVVVHQFDAETAARVVDSTIRSGALRVEAESRTDSASVGGAAAGGVGGVGGSVVVTRVANTTLAEVVRSQGTSRIEADTLDISATQRLSANSLATALSGGGLGVAGNIAVLVSDSLVRASLIDTTVRGLAGATASASRVSVNARDETTLKSYAGSLGIGGVGAGAGLNVALLRGSALAEIGRGDVAGDTVEVAATAIRDAELVTVNAGLGASTGMAGGIGVLIVGRDTDRTQSDRLLTDAGDSLRSAQERTNRELINQRNATLDDTERTRIDAQLRYSVADDAMASASRSTEARVTGAGAGGAPVVTANDLRVTASETTRTRNLVGSGAVGLTGLAAAGSVAISHVYGNVLALVSTGTGIKAKNVAISAEAKDKAGDSGVSTTEAANVGAYAGAAGAAALNLTVADGRLKNTVAARFGGIANGVGSGSFSIAASDESAVRTDSVGAGAGLVAGGVSSSIASRDSAVTAETENGAVLRGAAAGQAAYDRLAVAAKCVGSTYARAASGAGGVFGGANGAGASARESSAVNALVGGNSTLALGSGGLAVTAEARPRVEAMGVGVTVSGGLSLGAVVAETKLAAGVNARVGSLTRVSGPGGTLVSAKVLRPQNAPSAKAEAYAGTGGILVGANATVANAFADTDVEAEIGEDVTLGNGTVNVGATNEISQQVKSFGVAVGGLLSLGSNLGTASSEGSLTRARVGAGLAGSGGNGLLGLEVVASSLVDNEARATSGGGGLVGAAAAVARTNDTAGMTTAEILGAAGKPQIVAGFVSIDAKHRSDALHRVDAAQAAAVGGSGAEGTDTIDHDVMARLGSNLDLRASWISATANLAATQRRDGPGVVGGAGGIVNGGASLSRFTSSGNVLVDVGAGAKLKTTGDHAFGLGAISLDASTDVTVDDRAELTLASAVAGARVDSTVSLNHANTVLIGAGADLDASGMLVAGSSSRIVASALAIGRAYGLAGSIDARADAVVRASSLTLVGDGARLRSAANIVLGAGEAAGGSRDSVLNVNAESDAYNYTLVPASGVPHAKSDVVTYDSVQIGSGADIAADFDVRIAGVVGRQQIAALATLRNPYLELFSIESKGGETAIRRTAPVVFKQGAGTTQVVAGRLRERSLTIRADGTVDASEGVTVAANQTVNVTASINREIARLDARIADDPTNQGLRNDRQALVELRARLAAQVTGYLVSPLIASGGNVTLAGTELSAIGQTRITAYGGPKISIVNKTNQALILGDLYVPNRDGGRIVYAGPAQNVSGQATVSGVDTARAPLIEVLNQGTGGLYVDGDVENIGGRVRFLNTGGDYVQFGAVSGREVVVEAPNGSATISQAGLFGISNPLTWWGLPAPNSPDELVRWTIRALYDTNDGKLTLEDLLKKLPRTDFTTQPNTYTAGEMTFFFNLANTLANNGASWYDVSPYGEGGLTGLGTFSPHPPGWMPNFSLFANVFTQGNNSVSAFVQSTISGSYYAHLPQRVPGQTYLETTRTYNQATVPDIANRARIFGKSVTIRARDIDLNGRIVSGIAPNRSIDIPLSTAQSLDTFRASYLSGPNAGRTRFMKVPVAVTRSGDTPLTATYDALLDTITLDSAYAVGGGQIVLDGRIGSTSRDGKLEVINGFGDIEIKNQTSRKLVLRDVDTGRGDPGIVRITDRAKTGLGTVPLTTWYVHERGRGLTVYDNSLSGTLDLASARVASGLTNTNTANYDPLTGLRRVITQEGTVTRNVGTSPQGYWEDYYVTNWQWMDPAVPFSMTDDAFVVDPTLVGTDVLYRASPQILDRQSVAADFPSGNPLNISHFPSGTAEWIFHVPTKIKMNLTTSIKADNRIAIDFTGNDRGAMSIMSLGSIEVDGRVANLSGTTRINALGTGTQITRTANGLLAAGNLNLAGGSIGSALAPLQIQLGQGGQLDATARSGGLHLRADGDVTLGTLSATNGAVSFRTRGSMTRPAASLLDRVEGRSVSLVSETGRIGDASAPIIVRGLKSTVNGTETGGTIDASAASGIHLYERGSSMRVGAISTVSGEVSLRADGSILSAFENETVDDDRMQVLRDRWASLGILATDSASVEANVQAAVDSYKAQIQSKHSEYWLISRMGTRNGRVDLSGDTGLGISRLDFFRTKAAVALGIARPSDAQVFSWVTQRFATLAADLRAAASTADREAGRTGSNPAFDPLANENWVFTVAANGETRRSLGYGATWGESRLVYAIKSNALLAGSDTQAVTRTPNVTGPKVTLAAGDSIGRELPPLSVDIRASTRIEDLPATSLAALSSAGPGDIELTRPSPGLIRLVVRQRRLVNLLASDEVSADARNDIFIGGVSGLKLKSIDAGGDVRIVATGNILDAGAGTEAIRAANLNLDAGSGSVGANNSPLRVRLSGAVKQALARGDIRLVQAGGDLRVGNLAAGGLLALRAPLGSILSIFDKTPVAHLAGRDMLLETPDSLGTDAAPILVRLDGGRLDTSLTSGSLVVSAPEGDLVLGRIRHRGDATLSAARALRVVNAGGNLAATIQATGALGLRAGALEFAAGSSIGGSTTTINVDGRAVFGRGTLVSGTNGLTILAGSMSGEDGIVLRSTNGEVLLTAENAPGSAAREPNDMVFGAATRIEGATRVVARAGGTIGVGAGGIVRGPDAVSLVGGALALGAGSLVESTGAVLLRANAGNVGVGRVVSGATGTDAIQILATGAILASDEGRANLSVTGRAGARLVAGTGIGGPLVVDVGTLDAWSDGGVVDIRSLRSLEATRIVSRGGMFGLSVNGTLETREVDVAGGISLDVRGRILAPQIRAGYGAIRSGEALDLPDVVTSGPLELRADGIKGRFAAYDPASPVRLSFLGRDGGRARAVDAEVTTSGGLEIPRLDAEGLDLRTKGTVFRVLDGRLGGVMNARTETGTLLVDRLSSATRPSDAQFVLSKDGFFLVQDGIRIRTDAKVVQARKDFIILRSEDPLAEGGEDSAISTRIVSFVSKGAQDRNAAMLQPGRPGMPAFGAPPSVVGVDVATSGRTPLNLRREEESP